MRLFRLFRPVFAILSLLLPLIPALPAQAGEATVAVATNFLAPARAISAAFAQGGGHKVTLVAGSTGKLAAQILAGAPFDVLLAADQTRAGLLIEKGAADPDTRFTYATGRLVLWSPGPLPVRDGNLNTLDPGEAGRLAIANPKLAPYGLAAEQTLQRLGLLDRLRPRLVYGENIGQAFAIVATGNADAGLVALSQVMGLEHTARGHWLPVPDDMHDPIRQDAVLTRRGTANETARAFLAFLKTPGAREIMSGYGYSGEGQ